MDTRRTWRGPLPMHNIRKHPTLAMWGDEKGYIRVINNLTGEVVEIPYHEATDVWKADIRAQMHARKFR